MYQALYRKWRPSTFDEVIGQPHITQTLKNQVKTGKLSHAYIFIGTRGTGKTTCARILAKAVNCENPVDGNPCCRCESCRSIAEGTAVDVVEMDAASNNGVDNVRALREEAIFSPTTVRKRVYIIDEVHMLSTSAFNALLKIIEEPPEHLMFILATTELQKVPATILSRCQRHSFRRIDSGILADYLKDISARESVSITDDAAALIARLSDGGVRDSLSLLDQCAGFGSIDTDTVYSTLGLAGNRRTAQLLNKIIRHESVPAIEDFNSMWMDGKDPAGILNELCGLLRDTLIMRSAPSGGEGLISGIYDNKTMDYFVRHMTAEEIVAAMEKLRGAIADMKLSPNTKMTAEICIVSLSSSLVGDTVSDLRARLSRLEEALSNGSFVSRAAPERVQRSAPVFEPVYPEPEYPEPDYPEPEYYAQPANAEPAWQREPESEPIRPVNSVPGPEAPAEPQPEPDYNEPAAEQASAAQEPVEAVAEPASEPAAVSGGDLWKELSEKLAEKMKMPAAIVVKDINNCRGKFNGRELKVEVTAGFYLMIFQKEENVSLIRSAAAELLGREVLVTVGEMQKDIRETHSLDELRQFREVHFNN